MPLIYRAMKRDGDKPEIGPTKTALGAKIGDGRDDDIAPDAEGNVHPGTGGMSVVPDWRHLKFWRIPQRLRHIVPQATGSDKLACWRMGDGAFADGEVAEGLRLVVDGANHGTIQPAVVVTAGDFQAALAATRDQWSVDES